MIKLNKRANIIVRNIISTDWILYTSNKIVLDSFSEANIEFLLKLNIKPIET